MYIKQKRSQRYKHAIVQSFIVTFAVALGIEISGILHQDYWKVFTLEYVLVFSACFIFAWLYNWLNTSSDMEFMVNKRGVAILHNQVNRSFSWQDVANLKRPSLLTPWWRFTLKNGNNIKIQTACFKKVDLRAFEIEINKYL